MVPVIGRNTISKPYIVSYIMTLFNEVDITWSAMVDAWRSSIYGVYMFLKVYKCMKIQVFHFQVTLLVFQSLMMIVYETHKWTYATTGESSLEQSYTLKVGYEFKRNIIEYPVSIHCNCIVIVYLGKVLY